MPAAESATSDAKTHFHMAGEELRRVEPIMKQMLGFYRESVGPKADDPREWI
jgi:hypothetical protein